MGAAVVYATSDQFAAWLGTAAPANAVPLLRSASFTVALACQRDPYNDHPTGETADALRDATLAQAALWSSLGVNPDLGGLDVKVVKSSKIGTATVERDQLTAQQISDAVAKLAPTAAAILTAANLIWQPAPVGAPACDRLDTFGLPEPRFGWPLDQSVDWGDYQPTGFPDNGTIVSGDVIFDGGSP